MRAIGAGGVLLQEDDNGVDTQFVTFFSKRLTNFKRIILQ